MGSDFESLGSLIGASVATLLVVAAAYALGWLVIGLTRGWRSGMEASLLRIAAGLNLLGCVGVSLGSVHWLAGGRSVWLLLSCAVAAAIALAIRFRSFSTKSFSRRVIGRWDSLWIGLFAGAIALVTLGPALCYPSGWDELVYHHELPRRWLADGWPAFYSDLPYSGFPSLGEILFWLMAPIEGVIAPRLLTWICWLLGIAIVYRLLRRRLAIVSAAVLTGAFGLSGAVLMISANCYVESILLLSVAALLLAIESRLSPWRKAAIVGVLAGGAAAVKLTGLAVALLPCLWYALLWGGRLVGQTQLRGRHASKRRAVRPVENVFASLALSLLVAAAVALPFYLRPWLLTGNPFYPYYAQWFTTDPAVLEMSRYHHALGAAFGVRTPAAFLTGPILLAVNDLFVVDEKPLYDGAFGFQSLILLFFAVLAVATLQRRSLRPAILWPVAVAGCLYVFWYFTAQQARFAVPAALGLWLVAAVGLRRLRGQQRQMALALILVATIVSLPWRSTGHYFGSWMTALGVISRADYVNVSTARLDPKDRVYLPLIRALHEHTPADAKLMLLFEHRGFYVPRRFEIGTPFFQAAGFTPPEQFDNPDRLLQRLAERKITHVVITNAPAGPDQVPGWLDRLETFLPSFGASEKQGKLRVVWQSERYVLLEVRP